MIAGASAAVRRPRAWAAAALPPCEPASAPHRLALHGGGACLGADVAESIPLAIASAPQSPWEASLPPPRVHAEMPHAAGTA